MPKATVGDPDEPVSQGSQSSVVGAAASSAGAVESASAGAGVGGCERPQVGGVR